MPMKTGTLDIASLQAAVNQSVAEVGEDEIARVLEEDNANYTRIYDDIIRDVAETTTDRQRAVGNSIGGSAFEVDEYGQGPTQKDVPGYLLGFPLKRIAYNIGWTAQWLKRAKAADLAIRNAAARGRHMIRARYELQRAIFVPTNATFVDHLVDKAPLAVKALINADSSAIPNGPNGETFDGATHTHYDANATLTAAVLTALIQDVAEHRNGARIQVNFNVADAATVSALTGFVALQVPYVTINQAANQAATPRLDIGQVDNRQIGWFGAAEIWTKPWVPANYCVAVDVAAPQKPIVRRVEESDLGIHVAGSISSHPLNAEFQEWFYGFGVYNRLAMAVLRFNNGTYATPTLSY